MPAPFPPLGVADDDRIVFNVVTSMWERGVSGAVPGRVILPVFDDNTDAAAPGLTYKVLAGSAVEQITVQGESLTGIVTVDVSRDVNVAGNGGVAPTVDSIVVIDARIVVNLDCTACEALDFWGIILRDAAGNAYGAPSPIKVYDVA